MKHIYILSIVLSPPVSRVKGIKLIQSVCVLYRLPGLLLIYVRVSVRLLAPSQLNCHLF